jgi:pectate lyase
MPPSEGPRDGGGDAGSSADAGSGDAGRSDSGTPDSGAADAGGADAGSPDAGSSDAGSSDAGSSDAGSSDAGSSDAGGSDAGTADAGGLDSGTGDAGQSDAGSTDAGIDAGPLVPIPIEGFGEDTVGGWQPGYTSYVVTTLANDGAGSLREGCRTMNAPTVITFALDGRIALTSPIDLPSNLTIDGRGHDVGVTGKGFWVHGNNDIIITHFAIEEIGPNSEDGIQIGLPNIAPAHHVVLDHVLFSQSGNNGDSANVDEAISVIFGAHHITIAWCQFSNWEKSMLFGNGDADASIDGNISVTVHHNLFLNTGRRHPRARYGRFDVFNNFIYRWHAYDWFYLAPYRDSYGSWCQNDCQMRVENNIYERIPGPKDVGTNADDASRCTEGGKIVESGAFITAGTVSTLQFSVGCPVGSTVFARPYAITLETANTTLGNKLMSQTGN